MSFDRIPLVPMTATSVAWPSASPAPDRRRRRRELWELKVSQCSIVGTCCTLAEIRKIGCRTGVINPRVDPSDYRIHTLIVSELGRPSATSRAVRKLLDEKYAGQIRKVGRLDGFEDFRQFWEEALEKGFAPGAYWALASSAHVPDEFCVWLFGEIHMMSHLCGSTARGALRQDVEAAAAQAEELAKLEREKRSALQTIEELKARLEESERCMTALTARLKSVESGRTGVDPGPPSGCENHERLLRNAHRRIAELERKLASRREPMKPPVAESSSLDASSIEAELHDCDLNGCRLLYVGGVASAVCKLRQITQRCSGCFLHHDGGIEQSMDELEGLASRADIVILPVRNVSHQAARRIKEFCRARGVPFKPLRSSSISAFNRALYEFRSASHKT